jgi:hypothetical protein
LDVNRLRDKRLLEAYLEGKNDISEELVLRSPEGAILDPDNLYHRVSFRCWPKPASAKYVFMICGTPLHRYSSKMGIDCLREGANGRSSIQVTVDTYGHLIPGADVSFVDRPDEVPVEKAKRSSQQSATPAQPKGGTSSGNPANGEGDAPTTGDYPPTLPLRGLEPHKQ